MPTDLPRRLWLKDNHPTMVKFNKLCDYAEELGLTISFCNNSTVIEDTKRDPKLPTLFVEDNEDGTPVGVFPPGLEFKVVYENPEYLTQKKQEDEAYSRMRAEEEDQKKRETQKQKGLVKSL